MAVAGVATATELGFSVPADVSVVAWEDSALCRMVKPWLSALVDGGPARTVRVPVPRVIVRESTGAARGA